ncbi:hypothetical protein RhiirA1_470586 [Rhizophagus irregularis]|uniref:Uncharacterized protein n=1 Tax=Rhizophagus irregularis TaxID=588596 RepID=A0A2N0R5V4_9GLOM|nr:hypothetical protein RhiirA1_470586 [Rhizophagus irregularis]
MDDISVKNNDDANKIEIDVDKIDVDKIDFDKIEVNKNDVDKNDDEIFTFDNQLHNEDCSIVGWDVEDIDKVQLEFDQTVRPNENKKYKIKSLCVSDDNKLAYITIDRHRNIYRNGNLDEYTTITVIDMNNEVKNIALDLIKNDSLTSYCTFNLKGEFILYSDCQSNYQKIIWIYSTQTKNNKWECKRFYRIPENYELISISKYDKVYLFSNDYIYEWNINTERNVKIFGNNKNKNKFETVDIGIFSNEKFIFLKINYKIIVYSNELGIPIASLDINNDIQLYKFMNHTGLFLLPSLFYYTPDKVFKYCWNNKYKNRFNGTLLEEPSDDESTDESTDEQTKFVFGIQNRHVWKSKLDEKMSKMNFSSENSDELNKENNKIIECDEYLNVHSFNLYMDAVSTLFQKVTTNGESAESPSKTFKELTESTVNLIKWDVRIGGSKIKLEVFNKHNTEWESISTRTENYPYKPKYSFYYHKLVVMKITTLFL